VQEDLSGDEGAARFPQWMLAAASDRSGLIRKSGARPEAARRQRMT
jgi:hypothetical protein